MNDLQRLMSVHEGACLDCDGDLNMVEAGGTIDFLLDHFGIVRRVSLVDEHGNEMTGRDCPPPVQGTVLTIEHEGKTYSLSVGFYTHLKTVNVWEPSADGYGDVGVQIFECEKCKTRFETYQNCGGDWVLGG